jgi:hypothetical protein
MPTPLPVSRAAARRFLVQQFALDGVQTLLTVPAVLDHLEFVQEDSINVCGRIHDIILWARVRDYTPAMLQETLYTAPRQAFEYYFPNLCVLPINDYPYFRATMERRAHTPHPWRRILPDEEPVVETILSMLDTDGPLRTRSAGTAHGHTTSGWGTRQTKVARVAEKLWLHGRLAIARRENFERWFDRAERHFPDAQTLSLPDEAQQNAFKARKTLRAKRLFRRKSDLFAALPSDAITPVQIEGVAKPWFILTENIAPLLAAEHVTVAPTVHLLAPLDPLVYDRERNRALWGFDYTWEVYTPATKRKWGYYVLPILYGDKIVGRVDPKLDRTTGTLKVISLQWETGIDVSSVRPPVIERLEAFARFLGASDVQIPTG